MATAIKAQARDLDADLAICEAATPGGWTPITGYVHRHRPNFIYSHGLQVGRMAFEADAEFASEAREGWPYAIRRAQEAEREVDRLRDEVQMLQEQLQQHHRSSCFD